MTARSRNRSTSPSEKCVKTHSYRAVRLASYRILNADSGEFGPLVSRQNAKADHVLQRLFETIRGNPRLLPTYVQQRINGVGDPGAVAHEVGYFLATLTDRGALDLYGELFVPADRAMGHHVR